MYRKGIIDSVRISKGVLHMEKKEINADAIVDKISDVVGEVAGKVDLDKINDAVGDIADKVDLSKISSSVQGVLDKTDLDEKITEKGMDIVKNLFGKDKK